MRFLSGVAPLLSFCLLCVCSLCPPVCAKESDVRTDASGEVAPEKKESSRAKAKKSAEPAQNRDGLIKMESGSRQAYVGIHGGTAPLSLLWSDDGVVIAFTGRTGNDFLDILRGGNASRSSAAAEKAALERSRSVEDSTAKTPGHPVQAAPNPSQRPEVKNSADSAKASHPHATASIAGLPADRQPPPVPAPTAGAKPKVESALADTPAKTEGPALVFASSEFASNLNETPKDHRPFGLIDPADVLSGTSSAGPNGFPLDVPAFKPLKLRSYKRVLAYTGSL